MTMPGGPPGKHAWRAARQMKMSYLFQTFVCADVAHPVGGACTLLDESIDPECFCIAAFVHFGVGLQYFYLYMGYDRATYMAHDGHNRKLDIFAIARFT